MSRYSGSTTQTGYTVNYVNRTNDARYRNFTIEDLNNAIIENDEKTVIEVLNLGLISVNQTITRDPYRNTLLHTAIIMENPRVIQKLIDLGADLRIKNKKGESSADLLSKSHLGEIIQYISDKNTEKFSSITQELKEKDFKIKNLEENVTRLEGHNNQLFKERQNFEVEVVQLRKRKAELEESNSVLRQATKKPKNYNPKQFILTISPSFDVISNPFFFQKFIAFIFDFLT